MRDDLLAQLETWHEEDEFAEIVQAIMEVPTEERDYALVSHLGRALNNLERYEEAVEQFLTVAEEGREDPLWHYRIGLAYYYLEQYDDALRDFEIADQLDPGDEDTLEFLEWIRSKTASQSETDPDEPAAEVDADSNVATGSAADSAVHFDSDFDFASFWDDREDALEKYVSEPPTEELVGSVEEELVFRLPAFYVRMMKIHNGGIPRNRYFPIGESANGTTGSIQISGILGIGREKPHSLCGASGSRVTIENEGYPEIGVVICDCPAESGVVMLDYRESGNDGEPEVIYVDKEHKKISRLAPSFEAFVRGLVSEGL